MKLFSPIVEWVNLQLAKGRNIPYPIVLIPTSNLHIIQPTTFSNKQYLGKWVELKENTSFKEPDGKLSPDVVELNRIPGFSTNCIPASKRVHLFIRIKKEFQDIYGVPWTQGTEGLTPPKDAYEIVSNRKRYFIPILKIHGFKDKYTNPPDKPESVFEFEVQVKHAPIISNYWHFEFSVFADGKEMPIANAKWKKLICSSICDRIRQIAVFKI